MHIKEKVIIVTGAASGIGRALAERVREEGAAAVVVCDIDAAKAKAVADRIGGLDGVLTPAKWQTSPCRRWLKNASWPCPIPRCSTTSSKRPPIMTAGSRPCSVYATNFQRDKKTCCLSRAFEMFIGKARYSGQILEIGRVHHLPPSDMLFFSGALETQKTGMRAV
jgi:hypothetical protein